MLSLWLIVIQRVPEPVNGISPDTHEPFLRRCNSCTRADKLCRPGFRGWRNRHAGLAALAGGPSHRCCENRQPNRPTTHGKTGCHWLQSRSEKAPLPMELIQKAHTERSEEH